MTMELAPVFPETNVIHFNILSENYFLCTVQTFY